MPRETMNPQSLLRLTPTKLAQNITGNLKKNHGILKKYKWNFDIMQVLA